MQSQIPPSVVEKQAPAAAPTANATKPVFYMGDMSGGPIEPMEARTLEDAVKEAEKDAQDRAADTASSEARTALQDWVVYSLDSEGEYFHEDYGLVQADPEEPKCTKHKGGKHLWHNPDPEWAAYGNDQGGGVTVVRVCRMCGMERTECTLQDNGFGGHYDSVSYVEEYDSKSFASYMAEVEAAYRDSCEDDYEDDYEDEAEEAPTPAAGGVSA